MVVMQIEGTQGAFYLAGDILVPLINVSLKELQLQKLLFLINFIISIVMIPRVFWFLRIGGRHHTTFVDT